MPDGFGNDGYRAHYSANLDPIHRMLVAHLRVDHGLPMFEIARRLRMTFPEVKRHVRALKKKQS